MRVPPLLLAAGVVFSITSCGSDSPSTPAGTDSPLECESRGYPCALSQVPIAILQRGDALGDEALTRLESGATTSATASWLDGQSDVAEVKWDETAIWFRPQGGAGIWILREGAFSPESRTASATSQPPPLDGRAGSPPLQAVVAGPDSKEKNALVLSPFHWQFLEFDGAPAVAAILSGTRGYESRVTSLSNNQKSSTTVGLTSFMGWEQYQVVHVSTHGKRICAEGACRATVLAGLLENLLPAGPGTKAEKLHALTALGVTVVKAEATGLEYVGLTADFFRSHYPNGLDNTLVFLDACQSFGPQATDVVDAIKGTTTVVFGWTEPVYSNDATATAVALYKALSERGYPAEVAYDHLGALKNGATVPGQGAPTLRMSERSSGDLRIRNVIYLLDPGSDQILTESDLVAIEGTENDGTPDAAPFLVRVDGVEPQQADGMMVHISIDGKEGAPVALTSGQRNGKDQWTVSGMLPLSYDLKQETPAHFRAWVNLPDEGQSEHESDATLIGSEPIMGTEWKLEAVQTFGYTSDVPATSHSSTGHLTLKFAPGQSPAEPHPRYVVTGGSVTYGFTHSYYDCTFTAPPITFDVTPEIYGDSFLAFNTTVSPVTYTGLIYTNGPAFQDVEVCEGGEATTETYRANDTWLWVEANDIRTVSADRRTIVGTHRGTGRDGTYIVESKYTITRVK